MNDNEKDIIKTTVECATALLIVKMISENFSDVSIEIDEYSSPAEQVFSQGWNMFF